MKVAQILLETETRFFFLKIVTADRISDDTMNVCVSINMYITFKGQMYIFISRLFLLSFV